MSVVEPTDTGATILESRTQIPADPPTGDYVVIDVTHFSTTVAELLGNGAAYVHITDERGDEPAFQDRVPSAMIGGDNTPAFEPEPGYDFFNSPSYVQGLDVDGRPTAMTSTNGGAAVTTLKHRIDGDSAVYVGGYTNARAVGTHLRERATPTYLVAAGSEGDPATDDVLGAVLIDRYLRADPPTDRERTQFRILLETAKGPDYGGDHDGRAADLYEYAMAIDSRSVVPRLEGQKLVDAA
ncbi:MAG: 2-phosphosulfolactate phosphatase [Halobacteriaceae archaeon]